VASATAPHSSWCDESPRAARESLRSSLAIEARGASQLAVAERRILTHFVRSDRGRSGDYMNASSGRASSPGVPFAALTGPALGLSVHQGDLLWHRLANVPRRDGLYNQICGRFHDRLDDRLNRQSRCRRTRLFAPSRRAEPPSNPGRETPRGCARRAAAAGVRTRSRRPRTGAGVR